MQEHKGIFNATHSIGMSLHGDSTVSIVTEIVFQTRQVFIWKWENGFASTFIIRNSNVYGNHLSTPQLYTATDNLQCIRKWNPSSCYIFTKTSFTSPPSRSLKLFLRTHLQHLKKINKWNYLPGTQLNASLCFPQHPSPKKKKISKEIQKYFFFFFLHACMQIATLSSWLPRTHQWHSAGWEWTLQLYISTLIMSRTSKHQLQAMSKQHPST